MLATILKTNRWIPIAAMVLILSFGIIIYDNLRTPGYARRLEEIGYPISTTTLETINPAIEKGKNANTLLYKANSMMKFPFDIEKDGKQPLPVVLFGKWVSSAPPVALGTPYPIEQINALKQYVIANQDAINLIHKASQHPKFFPNTEHAISYSSFSNSITAEGFDALLHDDLVTLNKDFNTLFRLLRLLKQPVGLSTSIEESYIKKINLLVENALNRREIPSPSLKHWLKEVKQIGLIDNQRITKSIVYSGIKEILDLEVNNFRLTFLENNWNAARLYLDFTGTWDNISKIVFPRMGNDLFHLIQQKDSMSTLQLLAKYEEKLLVLQSAFPPESNSIWDSNFRHKYYKFQYDPIPSLYDDFHNLRYTKTTSYIESYLYQSAYASVTQTGIALYLYGQDHGEFPETLETLIPEYLDAVPVNPFTKDEPIHYRQEEDRVVVFIKDKEISFTLLKKILNKNTPSAALQENPS